MHLIDNKKARIRGRIDCFGNKVSLICCLFTVSNSDLLFSQAPSSKKLLSCRFPAMILNFVARP